MLLNETEASANMIKQASAVMTLLKELVGLETVVGSSMAKNVKRGRMKAAVERAAKRGKKERSVMMLDHVNWEVLNETRKEGETSRQEISVSAVADVFQDEKI